MTIGLIINRSKDQQLAYTRVVRDFLQSRGCAVFIVEETAESADVLVVLGGDGTMLHSVRFLAEKDMPLLGINLGNVGHLTDAGKENGLHALEKLLAGEYTVQKRMMLTIGDRLALNDVVIKCDKLTRFTVRINDELLAEMRADGIIAATPTGSTAYNRSAGGPLLLPASNMIAITPICPFDTGVRPWVADGDSTVAISANRPAPILLDGEDYYTLPADTQAVIRRSERTVSIIKTGVDA